MMQRIERSLAQRHSPVYYQFEQWAGAKALKHGVFTRIGGYSQGVWASLNVGGTVGDEIEHVRSNQRLIYERLEVEGERACTVWQVHSADVVLAETRAPGRQWLARADGMVTNRVGVPLTMRFADCVPILFYDPVQQVIGIAHAGWRGTVGHVGANTVRTMEIAYGSRPADIQAAIGPSIGPEHYQVGPEVVEAVQQAYGESALNTLIWRAHDGSAYLDLWSANRLGLERVGVKQIETAHISTVDHVHEFFSHRAERGKTGRFCAVIALAEGATS